MTRRDHVVAVALRPLPQLGSDANFNVPTDECRLFQGKTDTCSRDTIVSLERVRYVCHSTVPLQLRLDNPQNTL